MDRLIRAQERSGVTNLLNTTGVVATQVCSRRRLMLKNQSDKSFCGATFGLAIAQTIASYERASLCVHQVPR